MKTLTANPSRYQINTRVWLTELSRAWAAATRLDAIPDGVIAVSQPDLGERFFHRRRRDRVGR